MTKKELEKEAGEWLKDNIRVEIRDGQPFNIVPTPVQIYCAGAEPREKRIAELEAQIEKMLHTLLDLLWFEENLDPYMYECNDAQKGELFKPFDNARLFLEKYKCKKCKGEGTIKVGYNGWDKNPCPTCKGKGYVFRR